MPCIYNRTINEYFSNFELEIFIEKNVFFACNVCVLKKYFQMRLNRFQQGRYVCRNIHFLNLKLFLQKEYFY